MEGRCLVIFPSHFFKALFCLGVKIPAQPYLDAHPRGPGAWLGRGRRGKGWKRAKG